MRIIMTALLISLLAAACLPDESRNSGHQPPSYQQTVLPDAVESFGIRDDATNADSSVVLLILQGGPHDELAFLRDGRSIFRYLPHYKKYDVVYLHQSQTLNPNIMTAGADFTLEDAQKEVEISAQILSKAIAHYAALNKDVIVLSHSYGSFITLQHLQMSGSTAAQYAILAARLDVDETLVDIHRTGRNARFSSDGSMLLPIDPRDPNEGTAAANDYRSGNLLKAAIGKPRYSAELATTDLSNVIFLYASNDEAVGALTQAEVTALEKGGAKVIETRDGHGDTIKRFIDKVSDGTLVLPVPEEN